MANVVYRNFNYRMMQGWFQPATNRFYLMLVSGAYTQSHTHTHTGHITHEISSPNYTRGGKEITNVTVTLDTGNNRTVLNGSSVSWTGITATPAYGIIYISGQADPVNYLLAQADFGAQTLNNTEFVVNWNAQGIYSLSS